MDKLDTMSNNLDAGIASLGKSASTIDEIVARLHETQAEKTSESIANLEESGVLAGITNFQIWDIPVGQAVVGGFAAVVASELVDGFLAAQSGQIKAFVKLGAAGASVKWGKKLLGKTGAQAVAILLAYDGLRSLLPIDEWASKLTGKVTTLTGKGLAGRAGMSNNVVTQANRVAGDYYAKAFGR